MRSVNVVAFLAAFLCALVASSAHAQYSGPWSMQWNFDGAPDSWDWSGAYTHEGWSVRHTASGNTGWNTDTATGSPALYLNNQAWAVYNLPAALQKNQFVFTAEFSWYGSSNRMRAQGLGYRSILSDNDQNDAGEAEGWFEGKDSSGSSRLVADDTVIPGGNLFDIDNFVGGGSSNLGGSNDNNGHFALMMEYNLNGDGQIHYWYRSISKDDNDNHADVGPVVAWSNTFRGSGNWYKVADVSIGGTGPFAINQLKVGGNKFSSTGEINVDNVKFFAVPEPSSLLLLGLALPAAGLYLRRRRAAKLSASL